MSMYVGPARVTLVEFDGRGINCEAFVDRLAMVLAIIDNGGIQRKGFGYGSEGHLGALRDIEKQISATRTKIAEIRDRDEVSKSIAGSYDEDE